MLHPRVPPLVRSLPHVESLSLFRAEEGHEEKEMRRGLGLVTDDEARDTDSTVAATAPVVTAGSIAPTPAPSTVSQVVRTSVETSHSTVRTGTDAVSKIAASSTSVIQKTTVETPAVAELTSTVQRSHPAYVTSLPPPPDPLPSSSRIVPTVSVPQVTSLPGPADVRMDVEDEDEPMPSIDLGSDSDED